MQSITFAKCIMQHEVSRKHIPKKCINLTWPNKTANLRKKKLKQKLGKKKKVHVCT